MGRGRDDCGVRAESVADVRFSTISKGVPYATGTPRRSFDRAMDARRSSRIPTPRKSLPTLAQDLHSPKDAPLTRQPSPLSNPGTQAVSKKRAASE